MSNITIKDYQDWLEKNPQAKKAEDGKKLSTYDELENKALYQQYVKQAELLSQRQDAEAEVQAQKETALRDNYIAQAQAQKKAEDVMKMSGMTSGVSESGLIDLYAQGAAARAGIINSSNTAKNDIFSEYRQALAESNAETNAAIAEIDAQREAVEESEAETKNQAAAEQFLNMLNSYVQDEGVYKTEDIEAEYKKVAEYLEENERTDIIKLYESAINDEAETEAESSFTRKSGLNVQESISLEDITHESDFFKGYNDRQYNAVMDELKKEIEQNNIKDGELVKINLRGLDNWNHSYFYYNGRLYKTQTWGGGRLAHSKKIDKTLVVFPNFNNSFISDRSICAL